MSAIKEFVFSEPLFCTHDHQRPFSELAGRRGALDFREFIGYAEADVTTAAALPSLPRPVGNSWDATAWEHTSTTGYGRAAELAVKAVLNINSGLADTGKVDKALHAFAAKKSVEEIFKTVYEKANIRWAVDDLNGCLKIPAEVFLGKGYLPIFKQSLRYDHPLCNPGDADIIKQCEKAFNCSIHVLADFDNMLDTYTNEAIRSGVVVSFKIPVAYDRPLTFGNPGKNEASAVFDAVMLGRETNKRVLYDYLFHKTLGRAQEHHLPVQVHTGYLAGNWEDIRNGEPSQLIPVFQKYRDIRFDLFHAGWPYAEVAGALGKQFPNVWLDLCWAWAMNPVQTERILDEWLAALPYNKIFGFGADWFSPFPVPGYALQAREGIAAVLEKKIKRGEYDLKKAKAVARRILHENAREFFKM